MNQKILTVYKSVTGFTREYAEMIAKETGSATMELKEATAETMSNFDTVIFGGRLHAGTVDGLKKAKTLFEQSTAPHFVVYATGVTPIDADDVIDQMWRANLSPAELHKIPHFYMLGGLRYEKMSFADKMMMKMFHAMMKKKTDKNEFEELLANALTGSYDLSSKDYIMPLVASLKVGGAAGCESRKV